MRSRLSLRLGVLGILLVLACTQTSCAMLKAMGCVPEFSTDHFSEGSVGKLYAERVETTCGEWSQAIRVKSGTLPPGLALGYLDDKFGISGTPADAGTYAFTLEMVARPGIAKQYAEKNYSITIAR